MPIHDWTRVESVLVDDFRLSWLLAIKRTLNGGLLAEQYYAILDQEVSFALEPRVSALTIRHASNHRVLAVIEIVSSGNKTHEGLQAFVSKALELLRGGVHLLVLELFPPGPRDPQGIHKAIWDELIDNDFVPPDGSPLTLAAYRADTWPEAFVEPTSVGRDLVPMPVFLSPDEYVSLPLEPTYQAAWELVPEFWRTTILERSM